MLRLCIGVLFVVAATGLLAGCKPKNQYVPPPPPRVSVAAPLSRKITRYLETTGSVQAVNTVDLVARVDGFLQGIGYKDGARVKKGDILFIIEPLPYQTKLTQAQAAEQGAQAQLTQLSTEYDRQKQLGTNSYSSQSNVDKALADRDNAQAALQQAKANTQLAAINLTYTRVLAPFDGVATAHLVSVGEYVGSSGATKLATVVQLDPIWVSFSLSEQDVQRIRQLLAARNETVAEMGSIPVEIGLQAESGYPHAGTLDYVNPGVDPATGTLAVRAVLANGDRAPLLPGYFARVRVPVQRDVESLLVPDVALGTDQLGRYLLVVGPDNVVAQRRVEPGSTEGELRVVESGLRADDRVIVSGQQRAIPGDKVDPQVRTAGAP